MPLILTHPTYDAARCNGCGKLRRFRMPRGILTAYGLLTRAKWIFVDDHGAALRTYCPACAEKRK